MMKMPIFLGIIDGSHLVSTSPQMKCKNNLKNKFLITWTCLTSISHDLNLKMTFN